MPIKRAIKYNNLTIDSFSFDLHYNTSGSHGLPPGVTDPKLAEYTVSGIKDAIKRWVWAQASAGGHESFVDHVMQHCYDVLLLLNHVQAGGVPITYSPFRNHSPSPVRLATQQGCLKTNKDGFT